MFVVKNYGIGISLRETKIKIGLYCSSNIYIYMAYGINVDHNLELELQFGNGYKIDLKYMSQLSLKSYKII